LEVLVNRPVWLSLLLVGCLASVAVLAPRTASAQASDDQQAHAHFEVAASYYEQANYESALREFLEAYRLSHRSQLFYNLSLCYQQLGDLENAVSYLERYLAEVESIENRASLETRLANLRERLAREQATGTDPGETTTTTTTETDPTETPTEGRTETVTTTETGPTEPTPTTPSSGGGSLNVGAIASFSVAAVGLILGATFTGLAAGEDSRVAALPCASSRSCPDSELSGMRTDALVADIMWGVALAGAAVGLVLVLVDPGGGGGEHASLRLSPSLAGLTLEGSF
jgi:Tfp pilus assembly protein PilF